MRIVSSRALYRVRMSADDLRERPKSRPLRRGLRRERERPLIVELLWRR